MGFPAAAGSLAILAFVMSAASAGIWNPNVGEHEYRNPIIFADYSDPDVVRVGDDFYMTASSFNAVPALPVLHSKDLVNWRLINHAIERFDDPAFNVPQHGNGVWTPAIRHHDGHYYICYGDLDRGIYMVKTRDHRGAWDEPILVKAGTGPGVLGVILKLPPMKQVLASEQLKSRYLETLIRYTKH